MSNSTLTPPSVAGVRERNSFSSPMKDSVPASASRRSRSPSRILEIGPPSTASGVTWIAAGTLPDAPDMRPSVTSATLKPRPCSTPSAGVRLCNSGMPMALGPAKRTTAIISPLSSPALNAAWSPC